jgi:hypothetical protein
MEAGVHRRDRKTQKRRDVLLGTLVHVEEGDDLAQGRGQAGDGVLDGSHALPALQPLVGPDLGRGHCLGPVEGHDDGALLPQHPMRLVADDAPEPAGEGRGLRQGGEREPGGDEGFLDDVFGLLEIADQSQGRAERHLLKAPGHSLERRQVATPGPPDQLFELHEHLLHYIGATAAPGPFGIVGTGRRRPGLGRRRRRMRRGATS